jgi:DNA-binding LytR/AlgR family response regulator
MSEENAKRIAINHKNIVINLNKIGRLETRVNNIQRPRPRLIGGDGKDLTDKIDRLEKTFKQVVERNNEERERYIQEKEDEIKVLQEKIEQLEIDNDNLRIHVNGQVKQTNANLTKFKSEILPVINKHIAHRGIRDARRSRR